MKTTKDMIRAFNRLAKQFNHSMLDPDTFKGSKAQIIKSTENMTKEDGLAALNRMWASMHDSTAKQELKAAEKKLPKSTPSKTKPVPKALTGDELKAALEKAPKHNGETLVAKGAYESETEALIKTGHTTHGKATSATKSKTLRNTATGSSSTGEAAAQLKLEPKKLRVILRKLGMNAPYPSADVIVKRVKAHLAK